MSSSRPQKRPVSSDDDDEPRQYCWSGRPRLMPPTGPRLIPPRRHISTQLISYDENGLETTIDLDEVSCGLEFSSDSNFSEYDVRSSPSTCQYMDSNLSDSSISLDYKVEKINTMSDKILSSDNGYLRDDSDVQITKATRLKTNLNLPARFKTCVQCQKENTNPYFQYCSKCFKFRMEYFENKPTFKQKRIRHFREENVLKDSQESSFGSSCELLSQKENFNSKDIEANKDNIEDNSNNLCNICLSQPKNGVINHGKIGHVYSCYPCAKLLRKKSNKCPLCNVKIKFVTKMIIG